MTIPIGLRRLDDVRHPFSSGGAFEGLIAERIELERVDDPHWAEFERTGDANTFATRHAEATRAWSGPTLAQALNLDATGELPLICCSQDTQNDWPSAHGSTAPTWPSLCSSRHLRPDLA